MPQERFLFAIHKMHIYTTRGLNTNEISFIDKDSAKR